VTIDYTKMPHAAPPPPPPMPPQQPRSWWSRNWGWVVAIGCLTPVLLIGACTAGIVFFVFGAIKSSDVYSGAMQQVRTNPEVVQRLGTPIESGWWLTGNVSVENDSGTADFNAPIHGPKGKAVMEVEATLDSNGWTYSKLRVVPKGGDPIDLTPRAPSPEESTDTAPPAG
jgi:hypothetical protein